jgi:hypothetical protein
VLLITTTTAVIKTTWIKGEKVIQSSSFNDFLTYFLLAKKEENTLYII